MLRECSVPVSLTITRFFSLARAPIDVALNIRFPACDLTCCAVAAVNIWISPTHIWKALFDSVKVRRQYRLASTVPVSAPGRVYVRLSATAHPVSLPCVSSSVHLPVSVAKVPVSKLLQISSHFFGALALEPL